jgi:2-(1,2-epoxy-1,2-dihydrophenyl)acetyl-CoA isomerase
MTSDAGQDSSSARELVRVCRPVPDVAHVLLDRPQARNSLTTASWQALGCVLETLLEDPGLRCIVLSGEGGYFSAGGDLKSTPAAGFRATASVARLELAHRIITRIRTLPIPVIAAVEGGAAGLGWSLALACDLIFTSADAKFIAPFVSRGVVPDGGAAWFLAHRIGRHRAAEILFTGSPLSGAEAGQIGLANRVVPAGGVVAAAIEFAATVPASTPHAMELTKRLLGAAESLDFARFLDAELTTAALCQNGPEAGQARRAFQLRDGKSN